MKNMKLYLFVILSILGFSNVTAQNNKAIRTEQIIASVLNSIPDNLYDLPAGMQRIAILEVESNLPKGFLRSEDLKLEIMMKLMNAGLKIISIPEFETKINLKIKTTDSSIIIDNRKPLSRIKNNTAKFNQLCLDNNIQGLFNAYLYYDSVDGPKLTMSIVHPSSKSVIWLKKIDLSQDVIFDPTEFNVNLGIGVQSINEIQNGSNKRAITNNLTVIPYLLSFKYLQYITKSRSHQLGFTGMIRVVNQTPVSYADTNLGVLTNAYIPSLGLVYKYNFLKKKSMIPSHWLGFQFGLNYFNYNQSFLGLEQALYVHLSKKMQIGIRLEQTFSEFDSYANDSKYIVKLDNNNYAIQISFAF